MSINWDTNAVCSSPIGLAIGQRTIPRSLESVSTSLDFRSINYAFSCLQSSSSQQGRISTFAEAEIQFFSRQILRVCLFSLTI